MKDTQSIFTAMLESRKSNVKGIRKIESVKKLKKEDVETDGTEMFTGHLIGADVADDNVAEDVIDNIQVVVDPEKTVDELEVRADEIQDAIEDSPEGKEAFSDEYIGDKVYACPICGESFFADDDYVEGDACPICKAEPTDGFLLQGVVAPVDEEPAAAEPEAEIDEPTVDEPEVEEPAADEAEDEEKEECVKPTVKTEGVSIDKQFYDKMYAAKNIEEARQILKDAYEAKLIDDSIWALKLIGETKFNELLEPAKECTMESNSSKTVVKECDEPEEETVTLDVTIGDTNVKVTTEPQVMDTEIDEESFEDNLTQFAHDNYGDTIDEVDVTEAEYDPKADVICLSCEAICKNGAKVPMVFELKEHRSKDNRSIMLATEKKGALKIESKTPAFRFNVVNENNMLKCEGMRYSYVTNHSKAGKVKVEGYCRTHR